MAKTEPRRRWFLDLNPIWPRRYGVAEFDTPGGRFFVAGAHLVKPWFSGIAEEEIERVASQLNWFDAPAIVMGDFNAAPWSRGLSDVLAQSGFKAPRVPVPTWPESAGHLGIPIDQALVKGARLVSLEAVGEGLGSNHRGLLATVRIGE